MVESSFARLTQQPQSFGRVLGVHTSAVGKARINSDLRRNLDGCNNNEGLYYC